MKNQFKTKFVSGFTLIELLISILLFSAVVFVAYEIFQLGVLNAILNKEYVDTRILLNSKSEDLTARGFFIWNVDTQNPKFPGNPYDPAEIWKKNLLNSGFKRQGTINVTFYKFINNQFVPFLGDEFDGHTAREIVGVEVALETSQNKTITQNIYLFITPSEKSLKAILGILKQALQIYAYQNGYYPPSGKIEYLVPQVLAEIPSDPFTTTRNKVTHIEELTDWYYENNTNSRSITLQPNSHFGESEFILTWNY